MIIGAISGFALMTVTGSLIIAIFGAMLAGVLISTIFAFLTQTLITNHVATGLALTIFGIGISAKYGKRQTSSNMICDQCLSKECKNS